MSNEKKIYRSDQNKFLGGVCAGFAEYFNVDVTLVRVLWLIAAMFQGAGAIVYLICLILIPKNPAHENLPQEEKKKAGNAGLFIGIVLIFIGLSIVLDRWYDLHYFWNFHWLHFRWDIIWPALLILFGAWYVFYTMHKKEEPENTTQTTVAQKKFTRSREDKMIAGVCGGLAKFWNTDPTIVRVGYALLTVFTEFWLGILVYALLSIAVDEEPFFQKDTTSDEPIVDATLIEEDEKHA